MKKLEFVTNTTDPNLKNASLRIPIEFNETLPQAIERHRKMCEGHIVGRPQATFKYTAEQLESEGFIGLYREVDEE